MLPQRVAPQLFLGSSGSSLKSTTFYTDATTVHQACLKVNA